jgi:UDP-GlcNAc3NAcA epimerase
MSKIFAEEYGLQIRIWDPYILGKYKPDYILAYGDCNSTVVAAGIAKKYGIPLVHVEAGLRCRDPIPEEFIRRGIDHLADVNLCPTRNAYLNLIAEKCLGEAVFVGDVLLDVFQAPERISGAPFQPYNLLTIHRQDSVKKITKYLEKVPTDIPVIWPIHPRAERSIRREDLPSNWVVSKPVPHSELLALIGSANHIYTDSGGVYREALWSGVPVTCLREFHEFDGLKAEDFGEGDAAKKSIRYLAKRV